MLSLLCCLIMLFTLYEPERNEMKFVEWYSMCFTKLFLEQNLVRVQSNSKKLFIQIRTKFWHEVNSEQLWFTILSSKTGFIFHQLIFQYPDFWLTLIISRARNSYVPIFNRQKAFFSSTVTMSKIFLLQYRNFRRGLDPSSYRSVLDLSWNRVVQMS
jgi:hypothetical protein